MLPKSTSDLIRNSTPSPTANDQNLQIHSRASRLSSISSDNNDAEYLVVEEYCRRSADDLSVSATPVYGNDEINGLRLLPIPSRLISVVTGSGGGSGSTLSPGIRSASTRGSTGGDSIIAYYESKYLIDCCAWKGSLKSLIIQLEIQKSNISPASPLSPLSPTGKD